MLFFKGEKMKILLLSTPVLVVDGTYRLSSISVDEARKLLQDGFLSAVGHQSTADMLSELLGIHVPMNLKRTGDIRQISYYIRIIKFQSLIL